MESQTTDEEDRFFVQSDPSTSDLPSTLRRRTFSRRGISSKEPGDSLPEYSINEDHSVTSSREPRYKLYSDLKANEETFGITESTRDGHNSTRFIEEKSDVESTVTTAKNDDLVDRGRNSADSVPEVSESLYSSTRLLVFIAGLLIKAIRVQLYLLITFITLPLSVLSCCYMFIVDPFRALRHGRAYIIIKLLNLWNSICEYFSPMLHVWLKYHKSVWKLVFRLGRGVFWATYVGCVLCVLLFTSLVISGVFMRYLLEEPLELKETLNFDYTKSSPVAFVPIVSCAAVGRGGKHIEKMDAGKNVGSRVIPRDHKLQVTVSMTLPESEYNRHLGIFQVRVDLLSVNGETLDTSSHACMLKFRSKPIRLLLTFFKVAPLVTGYVSEAQTLNLKIRGLKEGIVPTACLRVVLEQRAEYRPHAGIPELYDASLFSSLILESELPFIKRIIWYWKRTVFIWVSISSFIMELLFTLVCCRPMLFPRTRTRDASANTRST